MCIFLFGVFSCTFPFVSLVPYVKFLTKKQNEPYFRMSCFVKGRICNAPLPLVRHQHYRDVALVAVIAELPPLPQRPCTTVVKQRTYRPGRH